MRVVRKISRVLAWIFVSLLGFVLLVYLLLQLPGVQNYARVKVVAYLQNTLKTKVEIGKLSITFPRRIVLEDVYFEDQHHDTLLAGKKIRADIAFFGLLNNKVEINYIEMDSIRTNIYRKGQDTVFNFDYIVKAFTTTSSSSTASAPMEFKLDKVVLNNVVASYHDDQVGSDMYVSIGNFNSDIDKIVPDSFMYAIPVINLSNTVIRMRQYKPLATPRPMAVVEAQNTPPKFDIDFDKLNLKNVQFSYDNNISAVTTDITLGDVIADARSVDLDSMYIDLEDFQLNNTNAKIVFGRSQQAEIAVKEIGKDIEAQANNPWRIKADKISLSNNFIQYDDNNQPRVPGTMDYAHLNFQNLNLGATAVVFSPATIQASIDKGSFYEQKSGITLKQLETDIFYDDKHILADNLYLQTDRTILKRRVLLSYESLASMSLRPGDIYLEADIDQSTVAVRDVVAFAPALRSVPPFKGNEGEIFYLDAIVRGYIKDLDLPQFNVTGFRNTSISATGTIKGLPGTNAFYDLVINRFSTTKSDLAVLLPKGSIPPTVRLPEAISGRGAFKGSPANFNTRLVAQTNKGSVDLVASMSGNKFRAKANAHSLDVGYIFLQPNIGRATFQADITGNGFDIKKSPIDINAYVSSVYLNGYNYNNIKFDGKLRNGILTGEGDMKDRNADLDFAITSDLRLANPSLDLQLQVDSLNLNALGFSSVPFKIHGNININMPSLNMASLNGNATITDVVFVRDGKKYVIDTISLVATPNSIALRSEVGVADLKGNYNLTEIGYALQNIINKYYTIPGYRYHPLTTQQDWTLTATVFPSEVLFAFMPEIAGTDTVHLSAGLNTAQNDLHLLAQTRKLNYAGQYADSLTIRANTQADQFMYSATALSGGTKDIKLFKTSLDGSIANNLLNVRLDAKDREDKSRYQVSGVAASIPGGVRFSLNQDSLMFNYQKWAVGAGNFIQSTTAGLLVNNFTISNGAQMLSANSTSTVPNSPIDLRFSNFEISTITAIINQDKLLMGGTINGNALLSHFNTNPVFTSDINVQHFNYKGDTLGNITAKINNQTANTLAADIRLLSERNDVHLNGTYVISSQTVNMDLAMNKFDLASVKPFLTEQLRDIGGSIRGNMDVSGKLTAPKLDGTIRFDSAFVTPSLLGERFNLPNQELRVTPQGIRLDNFVIRDSLGGEAVIDGSIATTDFSNFEYDFYLTANDFRIMNSTRTANSEYWGKLNVDVDLAVYGNMKAPTLEGNLRVNKGTDLFVVLPGSNPEVVSRDGVVQFVDMDTDSIFANSYNVLDTIISDMNVEGLDIATTIETDTAAQFSLIVNDLTGDVLSMRGRADLAAGIDRSGKISLTGNYELNSGYYELSFEFIRRRFDIQKGSTVTWTGDPTQAIVDVTATYVANTAPINLVAPQLGESTASLNRFKQRLPFNVLLYLDGQILEPVISFDIQLPQGYVAAWKEVDDKLIQVRRDQAELNKQVFALLLLGRFVQENPFQDGGAGFSVARLARESVSRVITEQLNQWANELLPGFGLTLGVVSAEDYSTGELRNRTDLNVALTKQLFNDRIRVTIGSNFELEGPSGDNLNKSSSPAGGFASDVAIDYLLSKDGKYLMRAYRKNVYEVLVEGQVVETGLRFILTMDYNRFKELFHRRKKDEAIPTRKRTTTTTSEAVPKPVEQENK